MAPVFGHGRLRLYLLSLLAEAPRHGYEVIRLLEERFQGLYAPSAGTVYPRLAKLEQEGLVTHTAEGGRKVYSITDAGRDELADRQDELDQLESDIRESVAELAADIRDDVHGSADTLREEMRRAAKETGPPRRGAGPSPSGTDWKQAKQEWQRAKQEAKEQARRAKEESRKAREEARRAQEQTRRMKQQATEEVRRVKQQVQESAQRGDWTGLTETLTSLGRDLTGLFAGGPATGPAESADPEPADSGPADLPDWAATDPSADPLRELERLLDRFRDEIRDGARDHGVTPAQLARAARLLADTAARWRG